MKLSKEEFGARVNVQVNRLQAISDALVMDGEIELSEAVAGARQTIRVLWTLLNPPPPADVTADAASSEAAPPQG